jgi:hypothetical protein
MREEGEEEGGGGKRERGGGSREEGRGRRGPEFLFFTCPQAI